jgi:hypothetical protein
MFTSKWQYGNKISSPLADLKLWCLALEWRQKDECDYEVLKKPEKYKFSKYLAVTPKF